MSELKHVYPLKALLTKAWAIARASARRFGGTACAYPAAALQQAWVKAKALATTIITQRARVLAEVACIRAENSPLGGARRRREEAAFEARMAAHRSEMAARMAAYRARWDSGAAVPAALACRVV